MSNIPPTNPLIEPGDEKVSFFKLSIKPAFRFFSSLVLKGGLRDGVPGFAVATVNAYGVFQRYVKLLLLQNGFTEDKQISQVDNVDFELNETYEAYLKNLHKNSHKAGEDLYTKGFKPDFIDFMLKPFGQFWYQFLIKGLIFKGKNKENPWPARTDLIKSKKKVVLGLLFSISPGRPDLINYKRKKSWNLLFSIFSGAGLIY